MYTLNLNAEEHQALIDILECSVSEIHTEIIHTDRRDLKDCLKGRKQMMLKILETLRQTEEAQNA